MNLLQYIAENAQQAPEPQEAQEHNRRKRFCPLQ